MTDYRKAELYGGALSAELPATFTDVSDIRQVPDHQEVFLDPNGFTSIVFDILERVDIPDDEAPRAHLMDIIDGDGDTIDSVRIWTSAAVEFPHLPKQTPTYTLFATSPPANRQRGRVNEADFIGIFLCLIRLADQKTDIAITVNVPHVASYYVDTEIDLEGGRYGKLMERAQEHQRRIVETLAIDNWELFVQE